MQYAMFLPYDTPDTMLEWARKLERAGFASVWQGELTNSALLPLAAVAPALERIKLGAGVVLAFTHSPVMLAFEALDLDYFSHGRFILGLGVAHPNRNNNWYAGHDAGKPVAQMREYIEVLRLVMDTAQQGGGSIDYDGRFYQIRARNFFGRANPQPRPQVPIYLAAVKPRMAALTGELADGLVGNPMFSPKYIADTIVPNLAAGLRKAGRQRSDIEVLGQCFAVVDDDLATAYRVGAGAMLFSIWAMIYDDIFAAHGFADTVAQVRATRRSRQRLDAIELIPKDMVDAFCAVGPVDRVRAKVRERDGLLDTVIVAVPNTGTTAEQRDHYRNTLLEAFSD